MKPTYNMEGNLFYSMFNIIASIILKIHHRNIQNHVWAYIWALCPAKLAYKRNHHRALGHSVSPCFSRPALVSNSFWKIWCPTFSYVKIVGWYQESPFSERIITAAIIVPLQLCCCFLKLVLPLFGMMCSLRTGSDLETRHGIMTFVGVADIKLFLKKTFYISYEIKSLSAAHLAWTQEYIIFKLSPQVLTDQGLLNVLYHNYTHLTFDVYVLSSGFYHFRILWTPLIPGSPISTLNLLSSLTFKIYLWLICSPKLMSSSPAYFLSSY